MLKVLIYPKERNVFEKLCEYTHLSDWWLNVTWNLAPTVDDEAPVNVENTSE